MIRTVQTTGKSIPFSQLTETLEKDRFIGKIDTKPSYQREFIWSNRFKRDLIISILKGYPIGIIITRQKLSGDDSNILEIVDGQQRLKTINEFLNNKLSFNSSHSEIVKTELKKMGYEPNKKTFYFRDFPKDFRDEFVRQVVPTLNILTDDDDEVRNYFYAIQNQEKLKAGEIIEAFPETQFDDLFVKYESEIESFNEKISYKNNRKEFLKILFSILAFETEKLPLGTLDESIIKYVRNFTNNTLKQKEQLDVNDIYKTFENQLKKLNKLDKPNLDVGIAKKRFIKLALLFLNKQSINAFTNWDKLALLNKYLSKYNSKAWRENEAENIKLLIKDKLIKSKEDYRWFEELYNSFVGSKTKEKIQDVISFWVNNL